MYTNRSGALPGGSGGLGDAPLPRRLPWYDSRLHTDAILPAPLSQPSLQYPGASRVGVVLRVVPGVAPGCPGGCPGGCPWGGPGSVPGVAPGYPGGCPGRCPKNSWAVSEELASEGPLASTETTLGCVVVSPSQELARVSAWEVHTLQEDHISQL